MVANGIAIDTNSYIKVKPNHKNIISKLNLKNTAGLVKYALQNGF